MNNLPKYTDYTVSSVSVLSKEKLVKISKIYSDLLLLWRNLEWFRNRQAPGQLHVCITFPALLENWNNKNTQLFFPFFFQVL